MLNWKLPRRSLAKSKPGSRYRLYPILLLLSTANLMPCGYLRRNYFIKLLI